MTMQRPVIAITGPDSGGGPAWFFTSRIIKSLGGRPLRLQPKNYRQKNLDFDGLIVTGGADISATLFRPMPPPQENRSVTARLLDYLYPQNIWKLFFGSSKTDESRDEMETSILKKALAEKKPVLGICRGHQLINVVKGGRLEADISPHYRDGPHPRSLLPVKKIRINRGSLLHKIIGEKHIYANTLHNQAIGALAPDLHAVAYEQNGIVQGIERVGVGSPLLGVQWHPEYLFYMSSHRKIFKWLIDSARGGEKESG